MRDDLQQRSRDALERALGTASAYAGWRRFDPGPAAPVDARYAALPALTKRELRRDFPAGFVPAGLDLQAALARGEVEYVATAGTTGDAVTLLWHQGWWDASERASWRLNAHARRLLTGAHREAVLASPRCVGPPYRAEPRTMEERTLGRLLFLNERPSVEWTDAEIRRMAVELARYAPVVLEADPPYLAAFGRRARRLGLELHQPELLVFTYSYPSQAHLAQVRRAFRAPAMSSHGSTECGYVFVECEHGRLHQNVESCRVDVLPLAPAYGGPRLGRLLVTPFGHPWMSILRFDIGDLGVLRPEACACGNAEGVLLEAIAGRTKDVTTTSQGRLVTVAELDAALRPLQGLVSYRLDQQGGAWHLRLVSDWPAEDEAAAHEALRALYGWGANVTVAAVSALPPEPSGKYRLATATPEPDPAGFTAAPPPPAP